MKYGGFILKALCIDTSSKICAVAILDNNKLIKKIELNNGLTHSESLMPIIKDIFSETNLTLSDIDLLICDIGPGSFTGIRIGIATVKAFSDSFNIPIIGVSSLTSLAYNIKNEGLICSLIDCKNNNCYYSLYELKENTYTLLEEPTSDSIENCIKLLNYKYNDKKISFVGDGSLIYKEYISDFCNNSFIYFSDNELNDINIVNLGLAGFDIFNNNNQDNRYNRNSNNSSYDILPLYLKKPQAQRQLEEKNLLVTQMEYSDLENFNIAEFDNFWSLNILKDELKSDNSKFIVAKLENEIIGFAGLKIVIDEADIMNIAIKSSYRKQGVASLLLKNLIDICKNNNINNINLEVNEENFPAINLYKKYEFLEIGRRKKYYANKFDAILMKKNIT